MEAAEYFNRISYHCHALQFTAEYDKVEEIASYKITLSETTYRIKKFRAIFSYLEGVADVAQRHSALIYQFLVNIKLKKNGSSY